MKRVSNIVGDKAVGKTLLAIEACANFAHKFPRGKIWYREAEAAFDESYAQQLGLPVGRVDFGPEGPGTSWDTIEDIFEDLQKQLDKAIETGQPGLYIVDSLDALSTRAALTRDVDKGTFGLEKPKVMGQLFQKLTRKIKQANVAVIIVSQIRDKIGVVFGERHTRSGGKALDFYASQIVWLHHMKTLNKTIGGVQRPIGVVIKAKCKKNKVSFPFRECSFELHFGYGVRDLEASIDWLEEVNQLKRLELSAKEVPAFLKQTYALTGADRLRAQDKVRDAVLAAWAEVEERFAPTQRKYAP